MPTKLKEKDLRELFLFFSGIIISFLLQLVYDGMREEPFYQNIMSISHWRTFLATVCAISFVLMIYYVNKHGSKTLK